MLSRQASTTISLIWNSLGKRATPFQVEANSMNHLKSLRIELLIFIYERYGPRSLSNSLDMKRRAGRMHFAMCMIFPSTDCSCFREMERLLLQFLITSRVSASLFCGIDKVPCTESMVMPSHFIEVAGAWDLACASGRPRSASNDLAMS